jgi:hypothetical protein
MERLIAGDMVKIEQPLWLKENRHPQLGLARVG